MQEYKSVASRTDSWGVGVVVGGWVWVWVWVCVCVFVRVCVNASHQFGRYTTHKCKSTRAYHHARIQEYKSVAFCKDSRVQRCRITHRCKSARAYHYAQMLEYKINITHRCKSTKAYHHAHM